jgi:CubicO group peptidase (beta-lactamase class C family)
MNRIEYERVTPESVGIPSGAILRLIESLESISEMHGFMIMRHGKICAEGWWTPYAPGIRHGLQSLTKTYAATAIGIAYTEGLLNLDDRLVDIFADCLPDNISENLKKMRIRDMLCMGCGMDVMPEPTADLVRSFLAVPVNHEPGTKFMYNTTGSTMLGAIIRRLTGLGLHDYLTPRLFNKLGIEADNLRWINTLDGLEMGGGGLFATTEDNLRLMHLYLNQGIWEGERILAHDYVKQATSSQISTSGYLANGPDALDHFMGYGFQIWMCQPSGVYRADGAWGQYAVVFPDLDMIVAINETTPQDDNGSQKPLDVLWEYLLPFVTNAGLPESLTYLGKLRNKTSSLALKNPVFRPFSPMIPLISDRKYTLINGELTLNMDPISTFTGKLTYVGIRWFSFCFTGLSCKMTFLDEDYKEQVVDIALDGSRQLNHLPSRLTQTSLVYLNGYWPSPNRFELVARWIETCYQKNLRFEFSDDVVRISAQENASFDTILAESEAVAICQD